MDQPVIKVVLKGSGKPLRGVDVIAFSDFAAGKGAQGTTNAKGEVSLQLPRSVRPVAWWLRRHKRQVSARVGRTVARARNCAVGSIASCEASSFHKHLYQIIQAQSSA
jgi:hypothetical protein